MGGDTATEGACWNGALVQGASDEGAAEADPIVEGRRDASPPERTGFDRSLLMRPSLIGSATGGVMMGMAMEVALATAMGGALAPAVEAALVGGMAPDAALVVVRGRLAMAQAEVSVVEEAGVGAALGPAV